MDRATWGETEADGFGLVDTTRLTSPRRPRHRKVVLESGAMIAALCSLDECVAAHRADPVPGWGGEPQRLDEPGSAWMGLAPQRARHLRALDELPLAAVWSSWLRERPPPMRDADGLELLRVAGSMPWRGHPRPDLRHWPIVAPLVKVLGILTADRGAAGFLLDAAEEVLSMVPRAEIEAVATASGSRVEWRTEERLAWLMVFGDLQAMRPQLVAAAQARRAWELWRWVSEPDGAPRWGHDTRRHRQPRGSDRLVERPPLAAALLAHRDGAAGDDDLLDHLIGPRGDWWQFADLAALTAPDAVAHPRALTLAQGARGRIVALELRRGDKATPTTEAARRLRDSGGLDVLAGALAALGPKARFHTKWVDEKRGDVLSHLLRVSRPTPQDTPERFATALAGTPRRRLVEIAVYAPQWAAHVEHAMALPGLQEAVWWLHAHARVESYDWSLERSPWRDALKAPTPLNAVELFDGAVDVAWFGRVQAQLPPAAWPDLVASSRLCGPGGGRPGLFAQALLGHVTEDELLAPIHAKKRDADALRALGLLALTDPQALTRRWAAIERYGRESRQFGSSRRAREGRAVEIALDNLARTAGYADPVHLGWTMRAEQLRAALAEPPLQLGDLTIALQIEDGVPGLAVRRGERTLRSVPAAAAKDPAVKALKETVAELRRQAGSVRSSLEAAMVRGDTWTAAELAGLTGNPIVAPRLERLVLLGGDAAHCGLLRDQGRRLEDADGRTHALGEPADLRIAHPADLWRAGLLPAWQRAVVAARVEQPFKQVFREFYLPGPAELEGGTRWRGYVVDSGRAAALLSGRGWTLDHEEPAARTDHDLGIVAELDTYRSLGGAPDAGPAEIVEVAYRNLRGRRRALPAAEVPPRLFSETQRDIDLVVSVAGTAAQAAASAIATRAALVAATTAALGIGGVRIDGGRVAIAGALADYEVDLASGDVRVVCTGDRLVLPIGNTDLARVFLPHAGEDPRTAELLATVLLLTEDERIEDPQVRRQLDRRTPPPV